MSRFTPLVQLNTLLVLILYISARSEAQVSSNFFDQVDTTGSTSSEDITEASTPPYPGSDDGPQCYCDNGTPGCVNNSCPLSPKCVSEIVIPDEHSSVRPHMRFHCGDTFLSCVPSHRDRNSTVYSECCYDDYCNRCLIPSSYPIANDTHYAILASLLQANCTLPFQPSTEPEATPPAMMSAPLAWWAVILIVLALLVLVLVLVCITVIICGVTQWRRRKQAPENDDSLPECGGIVKSRRGGCSATDGEGGPQLEPRSICQDLILKERIGKGGFSEVYRALYQGDTEVAVKQLETRPVAQESWYREMDIFENHILHDDHVVRFYGVALPPSGGRLWIILEYCQNGSLYDVLRKRTLCYFECRKILLEVIRGLAYLHMEQVTVSRKKPGIAHRDLKSRNVLMRQNGTCCITDFGLAVKSTEVRGRDLEDAPDLARGTKRYMAPEVLNGTILLTRFEAYKQADIYAFALIMWEVASRCVVNGVVEDYQQPYFEYVSHHNPSVDEMRRVVVEEGKRPSFEKNWKDNEFMQALCKMMKEAWSANPNIRLSANRIKQNISKLSINQTISELYSSDNDFKIPFCHET